MSYPIKYPTPQGANIQIFTGKTRNSSFPSFTWGKPQGASFVWFTLIGGGGGSDSSGTLTGGGSGAVTNFMCPAFLIPDSLQVVVGQGGVVDSSGSLSRILYEGIDTGGSYTLLTALAGQGGNTTGAGGTATNNNYFTAIGFYQSVAGQDGASASVSASATTFLSGGSFNNVTANYGYSNGGSGFFRTQPIIVGSGGGGTGNGNGGIGCGGGGTTGKGGDGMVVIITW